MITIMIDINAYKGISPAKIIVRELEKRKMTQRDFSHQVGIHFQTLNNIINGRRKLTLDQALKIENKLGLEEGSLMILQLYNDIEARKTSSANARQDPS